MSDRLFRWLIAIGGLALFGVSAAVSSQMREPTEHLLASLGGYGLIGGVSAYVASAIARRLRRHFRPARYGPIDFIKVGFQLALLVALLAWLCLLAIDWLWDQTFSETIVDGSILTLVGGILAAFGIGTIGNVADLTGFNDRFGWEPPAAKAS